MVRNAIRSTAVVLAVAVLLGGCGIRRKKYTNPITKDTQQPDKVLFDKAINDIEHSRFEIARLLLQNLINTYDTSEYLAKAKLAIADAWFREGGSHGLAQAEAEYKDFILFYPAMEEAAEAQAKVDQFPIYSKADEALWQMAESYHRMGDRFEDQQVTAYQRIVKDYPLSIHVEDARAQLEVMKRTVPEADAVAMARMKFEMENRTKPGKLSGMWGIFRSRPDMSQAAKSGTPV